MGMHPNIATCYYVLSVEKTPHLFIEYVDGGSLADWIMTGKCRDLRIALSLAVQFCHGMEYTHSKGIIHRDIKPQNVLITRNALLKITDFGIMLRKSEIGNLPADGQDIQHQSLPDTESTVGFCGTPNYASPEQIRNAHSVDHRTDIFSFGLCLWYIFCGKKPFQKNDTQQEIPDPVPIMPEAKFPEELKELLKKTVAFNPDDRFQDFSQLRHALNLAYQKLFQVPCPYSELTNIDLRADSLNNHAVSLFELEKTREAARCLTQTLEINDVLPEALYNMILFKWRLNPKRPARILRQIEAAKKRIIDIDTLDDLEKEVKADIKALAKKKDPVRTEFPEFKLCIPPSSLDVFREGQLHQSVQRSVMDHLENRRFEAGHNVLMTSWQNSSFKKDMVFAKAYEKLLLHGFKKEVVGCQRIKTLRGNGVAATSLAYIPGTRMVVAGGPDGKVVIRDFSNLKNIRFLENEDLPIRALAVCREGKLLAVGTDSGRITLWSIKSGNKTIEIDLKDPVLSLAFSPDSRQLAAGSKAGVLKLFDVRTGKQMQSYRQTDSAVRSITFLNNSRDLASGTDDGKIYFWEPATSEYIKILDAHTMPVITLSSGASGYRFVSASSEGNYKYWESSTGRCLKSEKAHEEAITSALLLPDDIHLVTGCEDDIIKVFNGESGECKLILDGRGDGICSLGLGPKPHMFLAGRQDGAVLLVMVIYKLEFQA